MRCAGRINGTPFPVQVEHHRAVEANAIVGNVRSEIERHIFHAHRAQLQRVDIKMGIERVGAGKHEQVPAFSGGKVQRLLKSLGLRARDIELRVVW